MTGPGWHILTKGQDASVTSALAKQMREIERRLENPSLFGLFDSTLIGRCRTPRLRECMVVCQSRQARSTAGDRADASDPDQDWLPHTADPLDHWRAPHIGVRVRRDLGKTPKPQVRPQASKTQVRPRLRASWREAWLSRAWL